jgi:hypothetical protein
VTTIFHALLGEQGDLNGGDRFIGLVHEGKDIVFRFFIEYSSSRDFGPSVIGLFFKRIFERLYFGLC